MKNNQNLFFSPEEKGRAFSDVLKEVQEYISSKYSTLMVEGGSEEVKQQVKRYITKYICDYRITVKGKTQEQLIDDLYTEMAEFSFLTKYIFGTGIEEIDINSWRDIEIQYNDGRCEKLQEHFESPEHAVNVIRRMGTKELSDYSIRTYRKDELVYFLIQPSNLSVLSEESLSARIYGLMTVLKGITEIEMMCLNSRENFEDNKRYLKNRAEEETNPTVRKLLELDAGHLDRMQVQMATAREFLLIIRLRNQKENEVFAYLNRIEKMLVEQGFTSKRADEEDMKRILAVYFEQNVTTEKFEEFDGERWIILNE